jgi:hypothetical protein
MKGYTSDARPTLGSSSGGGMLRAAIAPTKVPIHSLGLPSARKHRTASCLYRCNLYGFNVAARPLWYFDSGLHQCRDGDKQEEPHFFILSH